MKNNEKIIAIFDGKKPTKSNMKSMIIDGKEYEMAENETYPQFYHRVSKEYGKDILAEREIEIHTVKSYSKATKQLERSVKRSVNTKRVAAAAVAGTLALSGVGIGLTSCSNNESANSNQTQEQEYDNLIANEDDQELKEIYQKLLKYADGEELVKELQMIDSLQEEINGIAIQNPDAEGKVSYVLSEELAAIHDVYNANLEDKTILESEEIGRCYYFSGQANLINLSQGSRDVQEIDSLIIDGTTVESYQEKMQTETQKALDDFNIAPKSFKKLAKEIYGNRNSNPEAQMEMAWGQPGLALTLNNGLTGKELANYQEASKNEGTQANRLFKEAYSDTKRFAVTKNGISIQKQSLINDALEEMNKKNHVYEYDNTNYNPSTTEKGQDMIKSIIGNLAVDGSGNYWVISKKTSTTTKRKQITKEQAEKQFGKEKVKEAEKEAEKNTKVDTDGDGKKDTNIPEANKKEEEKKNEMVNDYPAGYSAGQRAFTNGGSSTTSSGSSEYQRGYREGYAHAKSVYDKQKQKDNKTEETWTPEPTTPSKNDNKTTPSQKEQQEIKPEENTWVEEEMHYQTQSTKSVQQVKKVESYSNDKVDVIEIEMSDGVSYKSSVARTRC